MSAGPRVSKDHRSARRPARAVAGRFLKNVFDFIHGQMVSGYVLHIASRIIIAIPEDGSEVRSAHTSEAFVLRAGFGTLCRAVICV